ncbi:MAG: hypothetical protein ACXVW4_14895 [Nocardioides sp.]
MPAPTDGLLRATRVLVLVWVGTVVVAGIPQVFDDSLSGGAPPLGLIVLGLAAFFPGLIVVATALVLGLVVIARTPPRRVLRATVYGTLLPAAAVVVFLLAGVSFGSGGDNAPEVTDLPARGLGTWAVGLGAVLVAWTVLTPSPFWSTWPRRRLLRSTLVGGVLVVALLAWLHLSGRPALTVRNDTKKALHVELCPEQRCTGGASVVRAGGSERLLLRKGDPVTPDSVLVTDGSRVVGCFLVERDPTSPKHQSISLSQAEADIC